MRTIYAGMFMKLRLAILFVLFSILLLPSASFAQDDTQQDDVAAAARKAREKKATHAKKVVTDDDDSGIKTKVAFPELKTEGPANSDEIVAKVKEFKAAHTPQETEAAVRGWFDQHAGKITQLVQDVTDIAERLARKTDDSEDGDVSSAQMHAVGQDAARIREELASARRIRSDLKTILTSLKQLSLEYDLKIPEIKIDGKDFEQP